MSSECVLPGAPRAVPPILSITALPVVVALKVKNHTQNTISTEV